MSTLKLKAAIAVVLFLFMAEGSFAVTRFYMPSTGTAEVAPTFEATWSNLTMVKRIRCTTTRFNTTMVTETSPSITTGNCLFRQYVSDPLTADQTFAGWVRGQIMGLASSSAAKCDSSFAARIVSNDGTIVRGILLAYTSEASPANDYPTTLTNRAAPSQRNINTVNALYGDRVVIEIGTNSNNPSAKTSSQVFGDNGSTDLPVNQTGVDATLNPWVEFGDKDLSINQSVMIIE
jgi:hypothetical protein